MEITAAQREMRSAFLGGFMGQLVAGFLWLVSAAFATWGSQRQAILFLVVAGIFIFPLTKLGLRLTGKPGTVSPENGLYKLGAQVALVLPLSLPAVGGAALYRLDWFYPAFMIVLGAHYLPFAFLYGMRMFIGVAAVLWSVGLGLALWIDAPFPTGAWFTGAVLLVFAWVGRDRALREHSTA